MRAIIFCLAFFLCLSNFADAQSDTIIGVLRNTTDLSQFTQNLALSSDLTALLGNNSVQLTVFAPKNQNNPFNLSVAELSYHVVSGKFLANQLTNGELVPSLLQLQSLNGGYQQLKVTINGTTVSINGVPVVQADTAASNGVIHTVDSPLPVPGPLTNALKEYSTLLALAQLAGLVLPTPVTLFAPTDAAFVSLKQKSPAVYGYLSTANTNESLADLRLVLAYHGLGSVVYSKNIAEGSQTVQTLANEPLTITKTVDNQTTTVTVNSSASAAKVTAFDTLASDGVLHTLDAVLVPGNFVFNLKKALIGLDETTMLDLLKETNLTQCLTENCNYTIFAPTATAWSKVDSGVLDASPKEISNILLSHIYPGLLSELPMNTTLVMLNNKTLVIYNNTVDLKGNDNGYANVVGTVTVASNGRVYQIDHVLGVAGSNDDSNKKLIGWVIVGAMGGILIVAAVVVGVVWLVKRRRSGYEAINA